MRVRRAAVELVNRVGDPRVISAPRLLKYLRDEDWWVRERTLDALIEMKAGRGVTSSSTCVIPPRSCVTSR